MKPLVRALINAAAYLELADESQADPEFALQVLEEIAYNLSHCSGDARTITEEVLGEMRAAELENDPRPEMLEFLDSFLSSFGMDGEEYPEPDDPRRINLL
jgi:hypothetical protein